MKIDARIGVCTILLAAACSTSPPRGTVPPASQRSDSSAAAAPAAPAAEVNADRSQADVDSDLRKRGYKPMMYRGERVYCRKEALTGSNLTSKVCLTAQQIVDLERSGKDILNGNRQGGCIKTSSGCN
jgi:hypothetical protein